MITINELRKLAEKKFPDTYITLPMLLLAWAEEDPEYELSRILENTCLEKTKFIEILPPFIEKSHEDDKNVLVAIISNIQSQPLKGIDLLEGLCKFPDYRITKAFLESGLNREILLSNIYKQQALSNNILSIVGIDLDMPDNCLLQFGRDLTALAKKGAFDELYDRPEEIDRVTEVLLRKQKANAVLTGPAGVGKTALIEVFSRKVANNQIKSFKDTKIFELRMSKVVAGTRYRGDFEERMENIIRDFEAVQPAILFIDEMHLIWGAGKAQDVLTDAANILKPMLARGNARVIGATTVEEYNRYIAKDEALARRFQEIKIHEPDEETTLKIIEKQVYALSKYHEINIPEKIVRKTIELTNRHIVNRNQPDKTLDLLDSTAVKVKKDESKEMTEKDILSVLSKQTNRPISSLTGNDKKSLQNMAENLKAKIIGQDKVIDKVTRTLIQRRLDLGSSERNLATFLFAGDTGVGKTELARNIAKEFFGNDKLLMHVDLSEYNQPNSINKLIGAPDGYVGCEKEGVLVKHLHTHNTGVLLFDEVEKAHEDIHKMLLGLLDNGRVTSAQGETLDTKQCVVILTTNAISPTELNKGSFGFASTHDDPNPSELLSDHFPKEFLGRLDDILIFNNLQDADLKDIIKLRIKETQERLTKKNISLVYDEENLARYLLKHLKNNKSGARGIERIIETKLLQPVSMAVLFKKDEETMTLEIGDGFYSKEQVDILEKQLT